MGRQKRKAKKRMSEMTAKRKVAKIKHRQRQAVKNLKSIDDAMALGKNNIRSLTSALGRMSGLISSYIDSIASLNNWTEDSKKVVVDLLIQHRNKIYDYRDNELTELTLELERIRHIHDRVEMIVEMMNFVDRAEAVLDNLFDTEDALNLALGKLQPLPDQQAHGVVPDEIDSTSPESEEEPLS